jgi:hypothetical protein
MKLTRSSSLTDVAAAVGGALATAGIKAVLTGGACATIYSRGHYQSWDLDFILQSTATQGQLDAVMKTAGFARQGAHYEHPDARFIVEFPPGPLGIGADIGIQPVEHRIGTVTIRLLSPTDSCRDRLAAFYHWNDRQSLEAAVSIADQHQVDLNRIRAWSAREGASARFKEFRDQLRRGKPSNRS